MFFLVFFKHFTSPHLLVQQGFFAVKLQKCLDYLQRNFVCLYFGQEVSG